MPLPPSLSGTDSTYRMSSQSKANNAVLSYKSFTGGNTKALVRVSKASYNYTVEFTESQTRLYRAFYPHRRGLGQFSITIDSIGYKQYRAFMKWIQGYLDTLLKTQVSDRAEVPTMTVQLPSREFHKVGILFGGMDDHDQTASMVFSQPLTFITVMDYNDKATSIVKGSQTSRFNEPTTPNSKEYADFYPVNRPGNVDQNLYGSSQTIGNIFDIIGDGITGGQNGVGGSLAGDGGSIGGISDGSPSKSGPPQGPVTKI